MAPDGTGHRRVCRSRVENCGARAIIAIPDGRLFFSAHDAGAIGEVIRGDERRAAQSADPMADATRYAASADTRYVYRERYMTAASQPRRPNSHDRGPARNLQSDRQPSAERRHRAAATISPRAGSRTACSTAARISRARAGATPSPSRCSAPEHQAAIERGLAHFTGLPHVTIDGDSAVVISYLQILVPQTQGDPVEVPNHGSGKGFRVHRMVANRWELVRTPQGWKFKHRTLRQLDGSRAGAEDSAGALTK